MVLYQRTSVQGATLPRSYRARTLSVWVPAAKDIGREVLPPADQRLRLVCPPGVLFLEFLEELHQLCIALLGGIIDVLCVHLPAFRGVIEDAAEVDHRLAYASALLRLRNGHRRGHLSLALARSLLLPTSFCLPNPEGV